MSHLSRFEYMFLPYGRDTDTPDPDILLLRLSELGAAGWEACWSDYGGVFLKREIEGEREPE